MSKELKWYKQFIKYSNLSWYHKRKIIKNRRELRKFLRKQYFKLTNEQLEQISKFFKENDGVIMFG